MFPRIFWSMARVFFARENMLVRAANNNMIDESVSYDTITLSSAPSFLTNYIKKKIDNGICRGSNYFDVNNALCFQISPGDLEDILGTKALAMLYYQICVAITDSQKSGHAVVDNIEYVLQVLAEHLPADVSRVDKFKMAKLFTYGKTEGSEIEFYLKLLENKNVSEPDRSSEAFNWMIDNIQETICSLEATSAKYEELYNQFTVKTTQLLFHRLKSSKIVEEYPGQKLFYEATEKILCNLIHERLRGEYKYLNTQFYKAKTKQKVNVMLEPEFIINLLFYGGRKMKQEPGRKRKSFDSKQFCKVFALLSDCSRCISSMLMQKTY